MKPPPPFWAACPYCAESIELAVICIRINVSTNPKVEASADFMGRHVCGGRTEGPVFPA